MCVCVGVCVCQCMFVGEGGGLRIHTNTNDDDTQNTCQIRVNLTGEHYGYHLRLYSDWVRIRMYFHDSCVVGRYWLVFDKHDTDQY